VKGLIAFLLPLVLFSVAARCAPRPANAAEAPRVTVREIASTSHDSVALVVTWAAVADANGAATAYTDTATSTRATGFLAAHTITATVDTLRLARPAAGDSVTVTACVRAIRRGLASAPGCVAWHYVRPDVAPPAPAPAIDSARVLGSVRLVPDSVTLAEGDSALVTLIAMAANGQPFTGPLTIRWLGDSVVAAHPVAGTWTAWVVASPGASSTGFLVRRREFRIATTRGATAWRYVGDTAWRAL
jgi:hypothetical protein